MSVREADNQETFTFLSGHGNYDFMVKANYKICASAMPQLKCDCEEAAGDKCTVTPKSGPGGWLIRDEDYKSGDWQVS